MFWCCIPCFLSFCAQNPWPQSVPATGHGLPTGCRLQGPTPRAAARAAATPPAPRRRRSRDAPEARLDSVVFFGVFKDLMSEGTQKKLSCLFLVFCGLFFAFKDLMSEETQKIYVCCLAPFKQYSLVWFSADPPSHFALATDFSDRKNRATDLPGTSQCERDGQNCRPFVALRSSF